LRQIRVDRLMQLREDNGLTGTNPDHFLLPTIRPGPDCGFPHRRFWVLTSVMQMPDSLTTRLHHPWCRVANPYLCKRARTIPRMDALPYDKTAKSERFSVENLEAGCIIVASHAAP